MKDNFTPRARQVLAASRKEAERLAQSSVDTEHMLMGLIEVGQGIGVKVLERLGVDFTRLQRIIEEKSSPSRKRSKKLLLTQHFKKVLVLAGKEAKSMGHSYVGTDHLLLGLLREHRGPAAEVLEDFKIDLEAARVEVLRGLKGCPDPLHDISKKLDAVLDVLGRLKLEVTELSLAIAKGNT
jgi:ATP-dependent Clp protease ATP-binding subunit ClpC